MGKIVFFIFSFNLLFHSFALAEQNFRVGRKAAARYFASTPVDDQDDDGAPVRTKQKGKDEVEDGSRILSIGLGTYIGSQAYQWKGSGKRDNLGRTNYNVTYLIDKWHSFDVNLRVDYIDYKIDDDRPAKLSLLPLVTFPAADSKFPLYFGFGLGAGVFFQQVPDESNISLDYELVAGARFQDLFERFGFFFELAMKNHLLILSDGQLNGTTLNAGGVFTF